MTEPYWNAKQGEYVICPVEGCKHFGIVITKAHCRIEHQMSREEVRKRYAFPKSFSERNKKMESKKSCSNGEGQ
ncbi:hypothetical protein [Lysinibacillus fusiformis]|uniref:hypothetical protein n=1 Tax=Lysinibacillus fusiformis TaxID=28031 RepID=UPI003CFF04B4